MLKQYFFRNRFHWKPLPFDRHTLISFFTRVEQELGSISTPRQKTYSNLTLKEKAVLNDPKNNQSNIIKPCDQGGGICIMNTRDYFTKFHTHLPDHNTKKEKKATHPQPNKCSSLWCLNSHTLYTFPTHNRRDHHEISTASLKYRHTFLLWVTKNTLAKLPSPPCCFRMWWSNWPSLILYYPLHPAWS